MSSEWAMVLFTAGGIGITAVINFIIVAYYFGGDRKALKDLTRQFSEHIKEYNQFRRRYAALTGDQNGHD
jgi:hypothetical protein